MADGVQARASGGPRHHAFLDALRGIAVLGVVALHTVQNFHFPPLESAIGYGEYGVALFYMVSAFSLCLSLDQRRRDENRPLLNYAIRRLFRIAPMFYLAVVIYLLKPYILPAGTAPLYLSPICWPTEAWHAVLTVLFLNGWHYQAINLIVPGGWSVAVETNFYLLLPLLFRFATSLRRSLALFAATLVANTALRKGLYLAFAARVPAAHAAAFGVFSEMWLPSQLPVFALGIIMFRAINPSDIASTPPQPRRMAALFGALGASVLLAWQTLAGKTHRWVPREVLISIVLMFGAMLLAYRPYRALVNPFTRYLGKISYSVYLMHFVALHSVYWSSTHWYEPWRGHPLPFALAFPGVLALAMLISTITFQMVEVPGQSLGRRLIARLESRPRPAPTEEPETTLSPGRPGLM